MTDRISHLPAITCHALMLALAAACYTPSDAYRAAECLDGADDKPKCPSGYRCGDEYVCLKECGEDGHCRSEFGPGTCGACIASTCREVECYEPECGNGVLDEGDGEACDDGNTLDDDYCSASCQAITGACGDDIVQANEACDDGNVVHGDYCQYDCLAVTGSCGDRGRQDNEICDDGNAADGDYCRGDCQLITGSCGDGEIQGNETCDDGAIPADGDGCGESCTIEFGFVCTNTPSLCESHCGDGRRATTEDCDDGNVQNGDGCTSTCRQEIGFSCHDVDPSVCSFVCGDNLIVTGESCDDGDQDDTNWCDNNCQPQFVCEPDAPCWPPLHTGAHDCYDDSSELSFCPGEAGASDCAGEAHCGQDYQYDFGLKPNFELQGPAGEWVVFDSRTEVHWQRQWTPLPGPEGSICEDALCFYPQAKIYCAGLAYGGYDDWRLPTHPELLSIIDFGRYYPAANADFFPELWWEDRWDVSVWSSTPSQALPDLIDQDFTGSWGVFMSSGINGSWFDHRTDEITVMCARADERPMANPLDNERFAETTNAAGRVFYDRQTGFTWAQETDFEGTWMESLAYCEALSYAAQDDWRLPNIRELYSLASYTHERDAPAAVYPDPVSGMFWTATSNINPNEFGGVPLTGNAWRVNFEFGFTRTVPKTEVMRARCVRGGQ